MTCRQAIDDFLMRYVDGELTRSERIRFSLHLLTCAHCRRYLDSYRKTIALERTAKLEPESGLPEMPERLVQAILAARSTDKT